MLSELRLYRRYCSESITDIENFLEAVNDTKELWEVHHRLETHTSDGVRRLVPINKVEMKALMMYYNRPSKELIFLRKKDHLAIHRRGDRL